MTQEATAPPGDGRPRHVWLLATLVLFLFVRPLVGRAVLGFDVFGFDVLEVLVVASLLVGALTATAGRRARAVLYALAATAITARLLWIGDVEAGDGALIVFLGTYVVFFTFVVVLLVASLLREGSRITFDTLCGAVSVYLILGLVWSMGYAMLEFVEPGSLRHATGEALSDSGFDRFLGFSFATLTTLGYGNIAPATERADALAMLEAVVGQVFVAVVIARLVALQITQHDAAR